MRVAGLILVASAALALSHLVTPAWANDNPAILAPADGATVSSPVTVVVSPSAGTMTTAAQGGGMNMEAGSHLHLIVDSPLPKPGSAVPMDAQHIHLMHGEVKGERAACPGPSHAPTADGSARSSGSATPASLHNRNDQRQVTEIDSGARPPSTQAWSAH